MYSKLAMLVIVMMLGISLIEGIAVQSISASCVFPFKYKGELYHGCTTKDVGILWCSTTETYETRAKSLKWCVNKDLGLNTEVETYSKSKCKFPFAYKGNTYYGCTTLDHPRHKSWCFATKVDIDTRTTIQDLCIVEHNQKVSTFGGTSNGDPCHFPFYYRGQKYNGCTNDDYSRRSGHFVCGVKQNDKVVNGTSVTWGYCNVIDTVEYTDQLIIYTNKAWKSTTCVFPFTYNGEKQHGCIGDKPWCATTQNYDSDEEWKYCDDSDYMGTADIVREQTPEIRKQPQCSWPFVRDGILANQDMYVPETTSNGDAFTRYCSTTHNYDTDQKKMLSGRGRTQQGKCNFPFIYEGTVHHTCWNGEHHLWCMTDYGFVEKGEWIQCYAGDSSDLLG